MCKELRWLIVLGVLSSAVVTVNLPRGPAVDEAHARAAAVFRLAVSSLAALGIPFSWWMAREARKRADTATTEALKNIVAEVAYESDRGALWRCNLYVFRQPRYLVLVVIALLLSSAAMAFPLIPVSWGLGLGAFVVSFLISAVGLALVLLLALWLTIRGKLTSPSGLRPCRTIVAQDGLVDVTPEKKNMLLWRNIDAIREYQGDVYFLAGLAGCFIPRDAFADRFALERFVESARQLQTAARRA